MATTEFADLQTIGSIGQATLIAILLSSALAKLISIPRPTANSGTWHIIESWAGSVEFAVAELIASLILVTGIGMLASVVVAAAFMTMATVGLVRSCFTATICNCFGALTPKSRLAMMAIQLATVASAGAIFLRGVKPADTDLFVVAMMTAAPIVAVVAWRAKQNQMKLLTAVKTQAQPPLLRVLSPDLVLGDVANGRTVTVGDVIRQGQPLFIVGVHNKCKACKKLVPDIYALAKAFAGQFPIVIVADQQDYLPLGEPIDTFYRLVDCQQRFMLDQRIDGMPYAVLVNGSTGKTMSPPAQGDASVRSLFAIMLNARLAA